MTGLKKKVVILSIHDISPYFARDLIEILKMLQKLNIFEYSSLIVPYPLKNKLKSMRKQYNVVKNMSRRGEPVLHGFTHETTAYTNEFTKLDRNIIRQRILNGKRILQQVSGKKILGFVPPKWILSNDLLSILKEEQFLYTTTFLRIIPFDCDEIISPAVNFLYSYNPMNNILAQFALLYARYLVAKKSLIRIAIHPQGFKTRKSLIENLLKKIINAGYDFMTYRSYLNLANC